MQVCFGLEKLIDCFTIGLQIHNFPGSCLVEILLDCELQWFVVCLKAKYTTLHHLPTMLE